MEDKHKKILDRLESQCARREYCSSDMLKKAAELLDGDMEAAQEILGKLIAGGFIDDRRYAAAFAREKSGITGWGPLKIRFALGARHIPADIIAEAVSEIDGDRAGQKLRRLMESKWKSLEGDPAAKLKLLKYALSRGYDYEQVRLIAEEICRQPEANSCRQTETDG